MKEPSLENGLKRTAWESALGVLMLLFLAVLNLYPQKKLSFQGDMLQRRFEKTASYEIVLKEKAFTVVLDAGHGADDPGKIGCNQVLEKEVNLAIVMQLKAFLEAADVSVVLTRKDDAPLYEKGAVNRKRSDMQARISVIEQVSPDLAVSIHQNSYHDSSVKGPQVFYYKTSKEGKCAAELLQKSFDGIKGLENRRIAKANDTYYLLLHTSVPLVIAECGFLSNPEEAEHLTEEAYQRQMAWVLHLGILQYLNRS